ncbi:RNA methyltransferase [Flavihumibacter rivuli]|uniref:methyltransferase RsmF C-terminal domain-like protein n=1 Tax=Flavihumibacter rivuli TaxID=2838156 RepID=UPI001BDF33AE|nr:RsmB/NOP family class I SAM-dependent RNA methyltransferase [Flavihumibacter rivuli]ULQ56862.1 RNA methyltransferase [Flavihumibacter rivuli]
MSLPSSFIRSIGDAPGFDQESFCKVHDSGEQVVSIRMNPARISLSGKEGDESAIPSGLSFRLQERVPWSGMGYYLAERPSFTFDPLFHAGAYYVQEASSMFLEQAIRQCVDLDQPLTVLDLCAAPGGKSTHLLSLIGPDSVLVSNEVIRARASILEENITKWGSANVVVTNNDPRDFSGLEGLFDVIVVDAPCSGSGMFRKDPDTIADWSESNVALCSQRQQRILADVWPALKEGGILVYSTCSYSVAEDEAIADWLLENFEAVSIGLQVSSKWNIVETNSSGKGAKGYRFYPDKVKGEGFFITVFRKEGHTTQSFPSRNKKVKWEKLGKSGSSLVAPWLSNKGLSLLDWNGHILAMPAQVEGLLPSLQQLFIKKAGVMVGKLAGKDLVPDHPLALSTILSKELPVIAVDKDQAIAYLRRDDLHIAPGIKGWALVQYEGLSLGWVKALPNRLNNYYPKEWRILKQPGQ